MTLMQLRYFCEVASTKSFTAAAKNMYVAQSSVSIAIRELEGELELPLFIRHTRRETELTAYGEKLYPYISGCLEMLDEGLKEVKRQSGGSVRIGCFVNAAHSLIPWFLASLQRADINISLDIQQVFVDMFPQLLSGEYDLVINTNEEPVNQCCTRPIATQAVYLLVPVGHRLTFRGKVTVSDLAGEKLRFVAPESYMDVHIKRMFAAHGLIPDMVYSPDYSTLTTDVALGRGVALTTKMPVDANLLTFVPVDDPLARRYVCISWPTNRKLPEPVSAVLNHILRTSEEAGPDDLVF